MSLCDSCFKPGACCKRLPLRTGEDDFPVWDDEDANAQVRARAGDGMPFQPAERIGQWTDQETGRSYSTYYWDCPKLGADGRCTIYDDRPKTCRIFEPASDALCVHFRGAESGADIAEIPERAKVNIDYRHELTAPPGDYFVQNATDETDVRPSP